MVQSKSHDNCSATNLIVEAASSSKGIANEVFFLRYTDIDMDKLIAMKNGRKRATSGFDGHIHCTIALSFAYSEEFNFGDSGGKVWPSAVLIFC